MITVTFHEPDGGFSRRLCPDAYDAVDAITAALRRGAVPDVDLEDVLG